MEKRVDRACHHFWIDGYWTDITSVLTGHHPENHRKQKTFCAGLCVFAYLYWIVLFDNGGFLFRYRFNIVGGRFYIKNDPPQKKWQIGITIVVLLALGGITYIEHCSGDKTQPVGSEVGDKQNAVVKNKRN